MFTQSLRAVLLFFIITDADSLTENFMFLTWAKDEHERVTTFDRIR